MKNLPLKLTAFFCAIILWFYVALQEEYELEVNVPLAYNELSPKLALKKGLPTSVKVILQGKGLALYRERQNPGSFYLSLKGFPLGESTINLDPDWYISNQDDIKVFQILESQTLQVDLDTKISRRFAVTPQIEVKTAPNFTLVSQIKISPDSITLRGSRRLLRQIKKIQTEPLIISDLKEDLALSLNIFRPFGSAIELSEKSVEAQWEVDTLVKREFNNVAIQLLRNPDQDRFFLKPPLAKLTLTGAQTILQELVVEELRPFVDFNRFQIENKPSLAPTIKLSADIKSYQFEPNVFELDSTEVTP